MQHIFEIVSRLSQVVIDHIMQTPLLLTTLPFLLYSLPDQTEINLFVNVFIFSFDKLLVIENVTWILLYEHLNLLFTMPAHLRFHLWPLFWVTRCLNAVAVLFVLLLSL